LCNYQHGNDIAAIIRTNASTKPSRIRPSSSERLHLVSKNRDPDRTTNLDLHSQPRWLSPLPSPAVLDRILATYGLSLAIACTCYVCMRRRGDRFEAAQAAGLRPASDRPPNLVSRPFCETKVGLDLSSHTADDDEPFVCSICLCTLEPEAPTIELHCGHVYHRECLNEWLQVSTLCPLCKRVASAETAPEDVVLHTDGGGWRFGAASLWFWKRPSRRNRTQRLELPSMEIDQGNGRPPAAAPNPTGLDFADQNDRVEGGQLEDGVEARDDQLRLHVRPNISEDRHDDDDTPVTEVEAALQLSVGEIRDASPVTIHDGIVDF
jgi:hypothetical protein